MTILKSNQPDSGTRLSMAEILDTVTTGEVPLRFSAYDGSRTGPEDAEFGLHLRTPRGASYLATAPGDLGMARAYVAGDLERSYSKLGIEEDFFLVYGFVTRPIQALMHPRSDADVPAGFPAN